MNIIVTGTSRGIGRELVKEFCRRLKSGMMIATSREEKKLKVLYKECRKINPKITLFFISTPSGEINYFKEKDYLFGKINKVDIIVNNAAKFRKRPFEKLMLYDLKHIYDVNVFTPFSLIQACLPKMKKGSHIVNISSMGGVQGTQKFAGLSAYSSSKGALAVLTECLAEEFKTKGIAVNCLALGAVQTEMLKKAFPGYKAPITAKEMAKFIADFALTGNKYFNGKIIPVSLSTP